MQRTRQGHGPRMPTEQTAVSWPSPAGEPEPRQQPDGTGLGGLPPASCLVSAQRVLAASPAGLATDFDGTISAIAARPEQAAVLDGVRDSLRRLVPRLAVVAVVSGRRAEDVAQRVGVSGVTYVGNHGLEWHRDGVTEIFDSPPAAQVQLALARDALRLLLSQTPGFRLEEKGLAVALHYRRAQRMERARDLALELAGRFAGDQLTMLEGRRVVELRIASRWNKGTVMQALATKHDLRGLVYLGDDVTDADAFRALAELRQAGRTRTLSVAVANPEALIAALEAADVELDGPPAVGSLLYQLSVGFTARTG